MKDALPENEDDFGLLKSVRGAYFLRCVFCHKPFTEANVRSRLAWMETQISGSCENCWDEMMKEIDDGI